MQKAGELGREAVLPPDQVAPAQGNARRAPKVSVKPFQRLAESRDRVSGRSPQGAKGPGAAVRIAGLGLRGARPDVCLQVHCAYRYTTLQAHHV